VENNLDPVDIKPPSEDRGSSPGSHHNHRQPLAARAYGEVDGAAAAEGGRIDHYGTRAALLAVPVLSISEVALHRRCLRWPGLRGQLTA
jgi:hypothetical protein